MGTSNFYYKNASKVFAIGFNYEHPILDDDLNETGETEVVECEQFEWDEQIDAVKEEIKNNKSDFYYSESEKVSKLDNRSFPASFIASLSASKQFGDNFVEIQLNCFSRSGYYEGACLDYETEIFMDNFETDDVEDVLFGFQYSNYFGINVGMGKIQARNAQKWAKKTHAKMVEIIEKSFQNTSASFQKIATFSNGETIYQKC